MVHSVDVSPAAIIAALERAATRHVTPCGAGTLVWRSWGTGPPIVLLHGGAGSWLHWIKTIPALADTYTVWAPDLPGLGDSAMPPEPLTPETCAAVIADGLRALFDPALPPHLVTFSYGAHVGTLAAVLLAQRLRSLVISGSAALGLPHFRVDFAKEHSAMSADARATVHRANLHTLMIADADRIDALAIHIQSENISKTRFRSRPFASGDGIKRALPDVVVPLGAIWGARDPIALPSVAARLAVLSECHPNLCVRVIPDAGHWAMYEQPDAFNAALFEVLAELERGHSGGRRS